MFTLHFCRHKWKRYPYPETQKRTQIFIFETVGLSMFVSRLDLKAWIWALETHYRACASLMTSAVTHQAGVRHHLRQTQQASCLLKGQKVRAKSSVFMGAPTSVEITAAAARRRSHGNRPETQALAWGGFEQSCKPGAAVWFYDVPWAYRD